MRRSAPADGFFGQLEKPDHARNLPALRKQKPLQKIPFGANRIDRDYAGASRPYHPAEKYDKGEIIQPASFGFGEVVNLIDGGKMEVLFGDRLRCLVHG